MAEPPTEEEIQELVDGRLRGQRLLAVLAYLRDHPDRAEHVQDLRRADSSLRLLAHQRGGRPRVPGPARTLLPLLGVAAAALLIVWAVMGAPLPDFATSAERVPLERLAHRAARAHHHVARVGQPGIDFRAEAVDAFWTWSTQALGTGVMPPDLSDLGYTYTGARVLAAQRQPAGVLAYERPDGVMLSVHCWTPKTAAGRPRTRFHREGYTVTVAQRRNLGVAVVASRRVEDFATTAAAVFGALDTAAGDRSPSKPSGP